MKKKYVIRTRVKGLFLSAAILMSAVTTAFAQEDVMLSEKETIQETELDLSAEIIQESAAELMQSTEAESAAELMQSTEVESAAELMQSTEVESAAELMQSTEAVSEPETTVMSGETTVRQMQERSTEEIFDHDLNETSLVFGSDEEIYRYYSVGNYENVDNDPIYLGTATNRIVTGRYYTQLDETSKAIYDQFYSVYRNGASSEKLSLGLVRVFRNQTVTRGEDGRAQFSNETKAAIFDWIGSYVTPAFLALSYDHPELCWLSCATYRIGYSSYGFRFPAELDTMQVDIELAGSSFTLVADSRLSGLSSSMMNGLFSGAVNEITSALPASASRYSVVKEIHDWICRKTAYESNVGQKGNPIYQTPYSLFYDADGDGVIETVCAGYAKTLKVLCDRFQIPSVLVIGKTHRDEAHMWNYVQMEDGRWYGIDATWDDQGTILYDFFLAGANTVAANFGTRTFSQMHLPSRKWNESEHAIFEYPALQSTEYRMQMPGIPSNVRAAAATNGVQVSWNTVETADRYHVYRKVAGENAAVEIASTTQTGYLDTSACAGLSYVYTVRGENTYGFSGYSAEAAVCLKPSAPTDLVLENASNGVQLTWNASAGATGYVVLRSDTNNTSYNKTIQIGVQTVYLDTTAPAGVTCRYTVRAVNGAGTSSNAAGKSILVNIPQAKPQPPTGLTVEQVSGGVRLTWNQSAGATSYRILRSDNNNTTYNKTISVGNISSYVDSTAPAGKTCRYTVRAVNAYGTSSNAAGVSITVATDGKPLPPQNLNAENVSSGVRLTWQASAGATSYKILRSDTNSTSYNVTMTVGNVTSYVDTTAPTGKTCRYTVRAVNAQGTSSNAVGVSITVQATVSDGKPQAPQNLNVENVSGGVRLTWQASVGATSYKILRSDTNSTSYNVTMTVGNVISYVDTTAPTGKTCRYTVRAVNAQGTSSNAVGVSITVGAANAIIAADIKPLAPENLIVENTASGVQLRWNASEDATSYVVLRSDTNSTSYNVTVSVGNVTSYVDTTAPAGTTCRYTVRAVNAAGTSANAAGKSILVQE